MSKDQKIAWITGASTGIGRATALRLAKDGWQIAATARSMEKLKDLAAAHSNIHPFAGDVTNAQKMRGLVDQIESAVGPIDLALLNAGTAIYDSLDFKAESLRQQYEVNVFGTMHCLEPVLGRFKQRGVGHVAIVASVAGYRGLPRALSYGSSKAALINFTEALAAECRFFNIKVQLVNPGFVKTPLTDQNDFEMPMVIEVDEAAEKLVEGLYSKKFEINFPWVFCLLLRIFGTILPNRAYIWAVSKLRQKQIEAERDSEQKKNAA